MSDFNIDSPELCSGEETDLKDSAPVDMEAESIEKTDTSLICDGASNLHLNSTVETDADFQKIPDEAGKIDPLKDNVINANAVVDDSTGAECGARANTDSAIRIKMLARVSLSEAHFKHQQRGEPDLTMDEKIDIAQKLLDESEAKFLARFGNYLEIEDLEYFNDSLNVYEVNFYVSQIRKSKGLKFQRNRVKNRRYEAMKELIMKGEYFSEDEMKFREPYLYEQMVGQYMTDDELHAKVDKSDLRFSTILLKHIDQLDENARYTVTKDREEGQEEEEEEESDEDMEEEEEMEEDDEKQEKKASISAGQREELRAEFLSVMQQKFLQGEDKTFDYSAVDSNEAYDDLQTLSIEAEEKYFDDDDSDWT